LSINGETVDTPYYLDKFAQYGRQRLHLEIMRGTAILYCSLDLNEGEEPGLIFVPGEFTQKYLAFNEDNIFKVLRRIWQKLSRLP